MLRRLRIAAFASLVAFVGSSSISYAQEGPASPPTNRYPPPKQPTKASPKLPTWTLPGTKPASQQKPLSIPLPAAAWGADFCTEPYRALCESPTYNPRGRSQRVAELRGSIKHRALADTAKFLGRSPLLFTEADLAAVQPEAQRQRAIAYYVQRIGGWFEFEVGLSEFMAIWGNVRKVQNLLSGAIDGTVGRDPARAQLAKDLKLTVALTIPVDHKWIQAMVKNKEPGAQALAASFVRGCGADGLADNAFAVTVENIRYVVVCPGLLLGAPKGGDIESTDFRNILQALAHEMGHHIDSGSYPEAFAQYRTCLGTSPAGPAFVEPRQREITADWWAVQAIIQYFRTVALGRFDKTQVLRETFGALCGSPDDGKHPSGRYRIETLLRGDPELAALMGCRGPLPGTPACGVNGAAASY